MEEKAKNIIGRGYNYMSRKIVQAYELKNYITEKRIFKRLGAFSVHIACYFCLDRILEEHPRFRINGFDVETHPLCVKLESILSGKGTK